MPVPTLTGEECTQEAVETFSRLHNVLVRTSVGCLEWPGSRTHNGYGKVMLPRNGARRRRTWRLHRLAWLATHGALPPGLLVLHRCDNRLCCEPGHLYLGTHADNARDAAKSRRKKGSPVQA